MHSPEDKEYFAEFKQLELFFFFPFKKNIDMVCTLQPLIGGFILEWPLKRFGVTNNSATRVFVRCKTQVIYRCLMASIKWGPAQRKWKKSIKYTNQSGYRSQFNLWKCFFASLSIFLLCCIYIIVSFVLYLSYKICTHWMF